MSNRAPRMYSRCSLVVSRQGLLFMILACCDEDEGIMCSAGVHWHTHLRLGVVQGPIDGCCQRGNVRILDIRQEGVLQQASGIRPILRQSAPTGQPICLHHLSHIQGWGLVCLKACCAPPPLQCLIRLACPGLVSPLWAICCGVLPQPCLALPGVLYFVLFLGFSICPTGRLHI